jgi:hypothetical protein
MASDIGSAVAALQAAGEDIDALITAVGKAKFLDEIPGEDRQKLRGQCTSSSQVLACNCMVVCCCIQPTSMLLRPCNMNANAWWSAVAFKQHKPRTGQAIYQNTCCC